MKQRAKRLRKVHDDTVSSAKKIQSEGQAFLEQKEQQLDSLNAMNLNLEEELDVCKREIEEKIAEKSKEIEDREKAASETKINEVKEKCKVFIASEREKMAKTAEKTPQNTRILSNHLRKSTASR